MEAEHIDQLAKRYVQRAEWLLAGLALLVLLGMSIVRDTSLVVTLAISVVFGLLCASVHGEWWRHVAKRSPGSLIKFYLASSILRMLAAIVVFLLLVFMAHGGKDILERTAVFVGFYIALLAFDCIYFAQVEKKNQING